MDEARRPARLLPNIDARILPGAGAPGDPWQALFDQAAVGAIQTDADLCITRVNRRLGEMLGYTPEELIGKTPSDLTHPDDRAVSEQLMQRLRAGQSTQKLEKRYLHRSGGAVWVSVGISAIRDGRGTLTSYLALMEDITERRHQAKLLEGERQIVEHIAAGAPLNQVLEEVASLWEIHATRYPRCTILLANAGGSRMWVAAAPSMPAAFHGLMWDMKVREGANSMLLGKSEYLNGDLKKHAIQESDLLLSLGVRACWRQPLLARQGQQLGAFLFCAPVPVSPNQADRALLERVTHLARIAIEKAQAELAVTHLSSFDGLTALPNRSLLLDHLQRALSRGAQRGSTAALLLLDLDGMRQINESLGYTFGDEFLQAVAQRLRGHLKHDEIVARVGGDEFAVVLEDVEDPGRLPQTAHMLLEQITRPLHVGEHEIFVTASLGISVAPGDAADADTLLRHADAALSRAKARGHNSFQCYTADMNAPVADRLKLLGELRHALEREEFRLHYQPQLDLRSGRIAGAEALLRWQHPERGLVMPSEFVPLLEETGLILAVSEWVVRQVCKDIGRMRHGGLEPPRIAVNLSPRQFHQTDLPERIAGILRAAGVEGERLEVEITENLIMQEPLKSVAILQRLKDLHVHIAVDDFGTGYSSLSYLKRFPLDVLKLDKSFVDGVAEFSTDAAIADAVMRMAHSLGMRVVAEGVESEAQRACLEAQGCDLIQGYLCSRPLDFGALGAFLGGHDAPSAATHRTARVARSLGRT